MARTDLLFAATAHGNADHHSSDHRDRQREGQGQTVPYQGPSDVVYQGGGRHLMIVSLSRLGTLVPRQYQRSGAPSTLVLAT